MKFEFEMLFGCQKLVNRLNKLEILSGKKRNEDERGRDRDFRVCDYLHHF